LQQLRLPQLYNLRSDPFERAARVWFIKHAFVVVPAQAIVAQHLASFQQFPRANDLAHSTSSKPWRNSEILRRAIDGDTATRSMGVEMRTLYALGNGLPRSKFAENA
jgi:hypothetical protein